MMITVMLMMVLMILIIMIDNMITREEGSTLLELCGDPDDDNCHDDNRNVDNDIDDYDNHNNHQGGGQHPIGAVRRPCFTCYSPVLQSSVGGLF